MKKEGGIYALLARIEGVLMEACVHVFDELPEVALEFSFPPKKLIEECAWPGDIAYACFPLSRKYGVNPALIATRIAAHIPVCDSIIRVEAVGPYVNIHLQANELFRAVCETLNEPMGVFYGRIESHIGTIPGDRVMVEYLSPNTNKPLHLGHVRNGVLGMAISNMLKAAGYTVIKANLINDRGIHICKSMCAYQKWGNGKTPESTRTKGDHFVGIYYVLFEKEVEREWQAFLQNPGDSPMYTRNEFVAQACIIMREARDMLAQWEAGDASVRELWETMNTWVYDGFNETYQAYNFQFDTFYYESQTYMLGKDVVAEGCDSGVLKRLDNGSIVAELPGSFGKDVSGNPRMTTLQRADGTSLYMTQDIGTAIRKFDEHHLSKSIYVVGREQEYHFKCLFSILGRLGHVWSIDCFHVSYGMVNLPDGKMKSREGNVVDADDLLQSMRELAYAAIEEHNMDKHRVPEWHERSEKIALAAITFFLLKQSPSLDIEFNPKESISFDGVTGPYCLYAYARCRKIIRHIESLRGSGETMFHELGNNEERIIAQQVINFPRTVQRAAEDHNPSMLTAYAYDLSRAINQFYQKHRIIDINFPGLMYARGELLSAAGQTLRNCLAVLNIDVVEEM